MQRVAAASGGEGRVERPLNVGGEEERVERIEKDRTGR